MPINLTCGNQTDRRCSHATLPGDVRVRRSRLEREQDRTDLRGGEFGHTTLGYGHLAHVVLVSTEQQMRWADTDRPVAAMQDEQTIRDRLPVDEHPTDDVGAQDHSVGAVGKPQEAAIAVTIACARPIPARIGVGDHGYLRPEASPRRALFQLTGTVARAASRAISADLRWCAVESGSAECTSMHRFGTLGEHRSLLCFGATAGVVDATPGHLRAQYDSSFGVVTPGMAVN